MKMNNSSDQDKEKHPSKSILQTGSKQNTSKTRRVSWGENHYKEFFKHDEVKNCSGDDLGVLSKIKEEEKIEREMDSIIIEDFGKKINEKKHSEENVNKNYEEEKYINQNPFLSGFSHFPLNSNLINDESSEFDLLNTSKKRLTIMNMNEIFGGGINDTNITNNINNNTNNNNNDKILENEKLNEVVNIINNSNPSNTVNINNLISKTNNTNTNTNKNNTNTNTNTNTELLNNNNSSLTKTIQNIVDVQSKNYVQNEDKNEYVNHQNLVNNLPPKLTNKIFQSDLKNNDPYFNNNVKTNTNRITINQPISQLPFSTNINNMNNNINPQIQTNSRLTINFQEMIHQNKKESTDSDKPITKNKRFSLTLQEAMKNLYNDDNNQDEDSDNSLENRINERNLSNISASPINIKTNKLFYETCLSSASRYIEANENQEKIDKNNITINNIMINEEMEIIVEKEEQGTPKFENERNENFNNLPKNINHNNRITINPFSAQKSPIQSKNPIINAKDLISPLTSNFLLMKISQNSIDVDTRLNDLMSIISEVNKNKSKNNLDLKKGIEELNSKLNEFKEEQNKINIKKNQIKEEIEKVEKECNNLNDRKMILSFPMDFFGFKVLSTDFNTLKLQLFKRINLTIKFKEFSQNFLLHENKILKIEKINFEIIKANQNLSDKLIDDNNLYKIIKNIYEDLINFVIKPNDYKISIKVFHDRLKYLVKYTSSFLFLLEILNLILCIGMNFNLLYEKEKMSILVNFALLNKFGFKVIFNFEFEILNSFFGVNYRDSNIVNISLSETNFAKYKIKTNSFIEEVKNFLSMKDKLKNPIFLKEFLIKLNDNILNL